MALIDWAIVLLYGLGVLMLGSRSFRRSRSPGGFMAAGGAIPGWAVGFSLFGTYLSSNTFLGLPGKAYASNWNAFVFSLSLPLAASLAARYFVPFYRRTGEISAYAHLESRFGRWSRTYAMGCYLLTQLARIGSILLGVALVLSPLTGWSPVTIMVATGCVVTFYTLAGGIEAVIWTDVVQSLILIGGALTVAGMLLVGTPGGPGEIVRIATGDGKFSLGSSEVDFTASTVWVVFLYGLFTNLNNFGIDQSYVQRYHTARTDREARRSVWTACWMYVPISAVFCFIGTGLFAFYETHADLKAALEQDVALGATGELETMEAPAAPTSEDLGDRVFPHFIATELPPGVKGLLVAALFAAAMSSIDTSLNSSATVVLSDLYPLWRRVTGDRESMTVLYTSTLVVGALGTSTAVAMGGAKSLLDAWWLLSGIFAGGMLGLFLLGLIARRAERAAAVTGVVAGTLVIVWMTLSTQLPTESNLRSPFHGNMILVVGTLTIFLVGVLASRVGRRLA